MIVLIAAREWCQLCLRRKPAHLQETPPTWLPEYAVQEAGLAPGLLGTATLGLALARELSGETALKRSAENAATLTCKVHEEKPIADETQRYLTHLDERYRSIRRCC